MNSNSFIYLEYIRRAIAELPGVTEKLCFDTPAWYVNKKIFARMKEGGETLAIHTTERDVWMEKDSKTFFITDHYLNYSYMLINLATVSPEDLKKLLFAAWYERAPKKLIKEYELNHWLKDK